MVAIDDSTKKYLSEIGKRGGTVCSGRKAKAARENGKLGGRPKRDKRKIPNESRPNRRKLLETH